MSVTKGLYYEDDPQYNSMRYYDFTEDIISPIILRIFENGDIFVKTYKTISDSPKGRRIVLGYPCIPWDNHNGYSMIDVGHKKRYRVHRLVALGFIPNPDNKPTVNHKDGNKHNNHVSNLEWATYKEQMQHANRIGLMDHVYKKLHDGNHGNKYSAKPVEFNGIKYDSIQEACISTGHDPSTIHKYGNLL